MFPQLRSRLREAHRVSGCSLDGFPLSDLGQRNRRLSDYREHPQRGLTPDPLPDGESGEVQGGERPLDLDDDFFPVLRRNELREVFCVCGDVATSPAAALKECDS